jgi:hypothetical protein
MRGIPLLIADRTMDEREKISKFFNKRSLGILVEIPWRLIEREECMAL